MGKLAIVTGASSGIGLATAERFLAAGFQVINIARRRCENPAVSNLCCNLAWESALGETLDTLQSDYLPGAGEICLVHNAARMVGDSVRDYDNDDLKLGFAVQIMAPAMINRALIPFMPARSSIMYIGSTLSEKGVPGAFTYSTVKHAVIGMMRATCQDLAGTGIHSACICPGFTDTPMLQARLAEQPVLAEIATANAAGRLVTSNEIGEMLLWAHNNPVINGSVLHANHGQLQR